MKQSGKDYKRIVVKIGSSLFYSANNSLDFSTLSDIASEITSLIQAGKEVVVVSSGAIALGMHVLGLKERPRMLEDLQAAAAVGQNELMNTYRKFFGKDWFAAQILLTREDFSNRKRYLNAKNTLIALLEKRRYRIQSIVPIINENDTIATDEINFGDNDRLSALVATLIKADLLIMLSDVDGLLDGNKNLIPLVCEITPQIKAHATSTNKKTSVGGMVTKIEAAKIAADAGIPSVIANGRKKGIIASAVKEPQSFGTLFLSAKNNLAAKECWLAFGTKPNGKIMIDDGAKEALVANNKSLLPVGVKEVEGAFARGDTVAVLDINGVEFARGKVSYSSDELREIKGQRAKKEVIHRDNLVITCKTR